MINDSSIIETIVKRDRLILIGGLVAVVVLSWGYILGGVGMDMTAFEMTAITKTLQLWCCSPLVWTPSYALFMFFMWWVMMIAMMIPSASPMILLFAAINRKQREKGTPFCLHWRFRIGLYYCLGWIQSTGDRPAMGSGTCRSDVDHDDCHQRSV